MQHLPSSSHSGRLRALLALAVLAECAGPVAADPAVELDATQAFALHAQATLVEQATTRFHAPYSGPNSLSSGQGSQTFDLTLFLGARLWQGAQAWVNPEIDQGFGLDNTVGAAGFPSGEAYKVGRSQPYFRLPRLFLRQSINLGGEVQAVDADANQLSGSQRANRWVFTLGKFSVTDIFDANQYAHDPRNDFFNWTAIDTGTFDYAADAWGYTLGGAVEWYQDAWTVRAGLFALSTVPNSETIDRSFRQSQWVGELEHRHELSGRPGKLLLTLFDSHARMARFSDALTQSAATGEDINAALVDVRRMQHRTGVSFGLEQQLSSSLGAFLRAGEAGGDVEAYEFTDVDQTLAGGLSLGGGRWGRHDDSVALAAIVNNSSAQRRRFLNAGGLGILIGDGRLPHPGAEQIVDTYYRVALPPQAQLTFDYQEIINPAYNRDRGPVAVWALRLHAQF